jgi:N6-adenosine-specific RNA methylase IME4
VVEAWGFEYKTIITWGKDKFGLGQYYRGQTEQMLFAVRGVLPYRTREDGKRAQGRTLIYAPSGKHSVKPEDMRKWIEEVSHGPYIELFCSQDLPGWSVWGNEVETDFAASQSEVEVTNEDRVEIKSPPIRYGV